MREFLNQAYRVLYYFTGQEPVVRSTPECVA